MSKEIYDPIHDFINVTPLMRRIIDTPEFQHYASQPKNSTATRNRWGYRDMYKTDTHSDIIFGI